MYRYIYSCPAERLMTIDEAKQLSELDGYDSRTGTREARRSPWAWQSVEGVLSQTVSDAQIDEFIKRR